MYEERIHPIGIRVYVELNYGSKDDKPDGDVVILECLPWSKTFKIDPYSDNIEERRMVREILTGIGLRDLTDKNLYR